MFPPGMLVCQEGAMDSTFYIIVNGEVQVTKVINDEGVGIPAEALPFIFNRFFHTSEIDVHLFRGVGLGLSIARLVITQHIGTIDVESERGKGSTFTIRLVNTI
jgi:signal transduction histidine kinase